jgi:hypothetical protein
VRKMPRMNRKDIRQLGIVSVLPQIALLVLDYSYITRWITSRNLSWGSCRRSTCRSVPLNGNGINDYFGSAVNVAAPVGMTIREIPNYLLELKGVPGFVKARGFSSLKNPFPEFG